MVFLSACARIVINGAVLYLLLKRITSVPAVVYISWQIYRSYLADQAHADRNTFPVEARSTEIDDSSETDLLWYFAFGSNMDADILGRVRQVHPRQSHPCKVEGYVLTFAHRGLPYLEPGFGTIEPLSGHPVPPTLTLQTDTKHHGAAQEGKATMYSTPSMSVANQLSNKQTAEAAVADQDTLSPQLAALKQSSPKLPQALLNGQQRVEVHGVVHLISQQDMVQICKTEGGGGSASHGYYVQAVPCHLYNGKTLQALTLLTHPATLLHRREPTLPSLRYLTILQRGAAHSQLAKEYQVYLQALQHYHALKPGQRIGRWLMEHILGKPLRFLLLKVLPDMQNEFLIWAIHQFFHNLMLSMWTLHNYVMEPVLGSGCHL